MNDKTNGKKKVEDKEAEKTKHSINVDDVWEMLMEMQRKHNDLVDENNLLRKILNSSPHFKSNMVDTPSSNSPSDTGDISQYALVPRKKPKTSQVTKERRFEPTWGRWEDEYIPSKPYDPIEVVSSEEEKLEQAKVFSKDTPLYRHGKITKDGWAEWYSPYPKENYYYNSEEDQPDRKDDPDYTPKKSYRRRRR